MFTFSVDADESVEIIGRCRLRGHNFLMSVMFVVVVVNDVKGIYFCGLSIAGGGCLHSLFSHHQAVFSAVSSNLEN